MTIAKHIFSGMALVCVGLVSYAQDGPPPIAADSIYTNTSINVSPEYPGGIKAFYSHINKNFRIPAVDSTFTARVYVSFVVEKDGSMSTIKILRDPGYGLGEETIRVLKLVPEKWTPGEQDGKKVRATYNFPIALNFEASKKKRKK